MTEKNDIQKFVKILEKKIEYFSKNTDSNIFNIVELNNVYERLILEIINDASASGEIINFILNEKKSALFELDETYSVILKYLKLKEKINKILKKKCLKYIQAKNEDKLYELLIIAVKFDDKNASLFDNINLKFINNNMVEKFIDIYKINFMNTLKPKYLKKIAELYYKNREYEKAIEYFLNYMETTKPSIVLYRKLFVIFKKLNDNQSQEMCLKQIQLLEKNNG